MVVRTRIGGQAHTLRANYLPRPRYELYRRLFTISGTGSGYVPAAFNDAFRIGTYKVIDPSSAGWLNNPDTTWATRLYWPSKPPFEFNDVPAPDAQGFYVQHPGASQPPGAGAIPPGMTLGSAGSGVTYYESTKGGYYSFDPDSALSNTPPYIPGGGTIKVAGTVVWMLRHGFAADGLVRFVPAVAGDSATIVLVGSPNPARDPIATPQDIDIGIYFRGGLDVDPIVNVILVSDGTIELSQCFHNETASDNARRLSIYCSRLTLIGPKQPSSSGLDYSPSMGAVIDRLESSSALPRGVGTTPGLFPLLPGSWRDLTP